MVLLLSDKQEFLDTMLDYMPRDHREFILYLRKTSTVKSYGKEPLQPFSTIWFDKIFEENIDEAKKFIFSYL